MTAILVDANVLLDVLTEDPIWADWSMTHLEACLGQGLIINPMVYAELAARFSRNEDLDAALRFGLTREDIPWSAAFIAGKAYSDYRKRGGERRSPLPDFFIGAHAAVRRYTLLTRDARRYRTYFPSVDLICPDND